jgi:hypothetical protein
MAEEVDHGHSEGLHMWGDALADAREIAADLYSEPAEEDAQKLVYGNSAITYMQKIARARFSRPGRAGGCTA